MATTRPNPQLPICLSLTCSATTNPRRTNTSQELRWRYVVVPSDDRPHDIGRECGEGAVGPPPVGNDSELVQECLHIYKFRITLCSLLVLIAEYNSTRPTPRVRPQKSHSRTSCCCFTQHAYRLVTHPSYFDHLQPPDVFAL
jgi:hypothetical protein